MNWHRLDLEAIVHGIANGEMTGPTPSLMPRSDGPALLYPGLVHQLAGEPEAGKGWIMQSEAARVIADGQRVLYFDFEDSPRSIVERLLALGARPDEILERFAYLRPADYMGGEPLRELLEPRPALGVVDGVSEAYAAHELDSESNADVPRFMTALPSPIARAGAAVVLIDHVTKSREGRGRWSIGAQHKLAAVDVAYGVEAIEPPSRERAGRLKLTVYKDRHGHVRGHAAGGVIALVHVQPDEGGAHVAVTLEPPDGGTADGDFRPTLLMERASMAIEETPGLTTRELRARIKGTRSEFKDVAVGVLDREGYIEVREEGRGLHHYSVRPYRQEDDDVNSVPEERAQRARPCPKGAPSVPDSVPSVPAPLKGGAGTGHADDSDANGRVSGTVEEIA